MIRYTRTTFHYPAGDDEPGTVTRTLCRLAGQRVHRGRPTQAMRWKWYVTTRERSAVDCKDCRRHLEMGHAR